VGLGLDSTQSVYITDFWEYNPDSLATNLVGQILEPNSASVYPNPLTAWGNVSFSLSQNARVIVELCDLNGEQHGRLVDKHLEVGTHLIPYNIEGLASGLYLLRIKVNNETLVRKIVVE
jgi:hypothetical protein